jgi:hypothetical protein
MVAGMRARVGSSVAAGKRSAPNQEEESCPIAT